MGKKGKGCLVSMKQVKLAAGEKIGGYDFVSWSRPDELQGSKIIFFDVVHTQVADSPGVTLLIGVFIHAEELVDGRPPVDIQYRGLAYVPAELARILEHAKTNRTLPVTWDMPELKRKNKSKK